MSDIAETPKKPSRIHMRGFASMSPERRREIAAKGGAATPHHLRSFSTDRDLARAAGAAGGRASNGGRGKTSGRAA